MKLIENELYRNQISEVAAGMPMINSTIMVTGASGLIGSCLIDILLCADIIYGNHIRVIAVGRNADRLKKRFLTDDSSKWISFIEQDLLKGLDTEFNTDYIVHLASNADPVKYSLFPAETVLTNILSTYHLLEYSKENPTTRMLLASSFEVYGHVEGKDIYNEDDSGEVELNSIRSGYPESKRCAELLLRSYGAEHNVNWVIARLCSIYGPTMDKADSKAHAQFIRKGLAGEDVVLKSEGRQRRSYCYVTDAAKGLLTILLKGKSGNVYNISNMNAIISIAELAGIVADICGTKVVYELPDEVEKRGYSRTDDCILDSSRLMGLGWECQYDAVEGMKATVSILKGL